MNWYSRNRKGKSYYKYSRNSYYGHTFDKFKDQTHRYVKNEFFHLPKFQLEKVLNDYKRHYGTEAHKYFKKSIEDWKIGQKRMSDQTLERILRLVPVHLSIQSKFTLLEMEFANYIQKYLRAESTPIGSESALQSTFMVIKKAIDNFNSNNYTWFTKEIFNKEEIDEFIKVSRYLAYSKYLGLYHLVLGDLKVIQNFIPQFNKGEVSTAYTIFELNRKVDLTTKIESLSNVHISYSKYEGRYTNHVNDYLIHKDRLIHNQNRASLAKQVLQEKDLNLFYSTYKNYRDKDVSTDLRSKFNGGGGTLNISIKLLSIRAIRASIFLKTLYIFILILCTSVFWNYIEEYLLISIVIGWLFIKFLFEIINLFINIKKQINRHGR